MRIISQNGIFDAPYEISSLNVTTGRFEDVVCSSIYCYNNSLSRAVKIAEYSSESKSMKAMEMLRKCYTGMPIIFQNVEITEDLANQFKELEKCGLVVQTMNHESPKVDCVNNCTFQFPKDDEIEVET